jgi:uncharacterized membrane protein (DUF373 family)
MAKNPDCESRPTFKYLRILQRFIIILLLFIMSLILVFATFDLVFYVIRNIFQGDFGQLSFGSLGELFSIFLVILIGIELLEAVKAFLEEEIIHVEIVVLVAIIAIARKVIVWEFKDINSMETIGLAAMLLSLSISYALIKRTAFKINLFKRRNKNKRSRLISPDPNDDLTKD